MDIVSAPAELPVDVFAEMRASKPWLDAIASHEKSMARFHEVCDRVDTLYADLEKSAARKRSVLWLTCGRRGWWPLNEWANVSV